ncbi:hypothetical protein [Tenacibaculum sp. 190524A02b]|uniref:Uncharacterized protein n=1 Tax=Tenacibaculum vairaonense TaxID=3137860 RepID=A0ABM9PHW5_9FLAO
MKSNLENLQQFAISKKQAQKVKGGNKETYVCWHSSSSEISFHSRHEAAQLIELGVTCAYFTDIPS